MSSKRQIETVGQPLSGLNGISPEAVHNPARNMRIERLQGQHFLHGAHTVQYNRLLPPIGQGQLHLQHAHLLPEIGWAGLVQANFAYICNKVWQKNGFFRRVKGFVAGPICVKVW